MRHHALVERPGNAGQAKAPNSLLFVFSLAGVTVFFCDLPKFDHGTGAKRLLAPVRLTTLHRTDARPVSMKTGEQMPCSVPAAEAAINPGTKRTTLVKVCLGGYCRNNTSSVRYSLCTNAHTSFQVTARFFWHVPRHNVRFTNASLQVKPWNIVQNFSWERCVCCRADQHQVSDRCGVIVHRTVGAVTSRHAFGPRPR